MGLKENSMKRRAAPVAKTGDGKGALWGNRITFGHHLAKRVALPYKKYPEKWP
jgi:hypothetical protein